MLKLFCITFIAGIAIVNCHPNPKLSNDGVVKNVAGAATQSIAINLLKHNKDSNENVIFSPFGFSTILAFLNEGAKGETYKQIATMLRHPDDIEKVRRDYNEVLKYLQGDNPLLAPQFKSWFYVYANNTVEDAYRNILSNNYFVEVKQIQREIFDWNEPKTAIELDDVEEKSNEETVDENIGQEDEQVPVTTDINDPTISTTSVNSKDIIGFEDLKKSEPFDDEPAVKNDEPVIEKECSKFDSTIEDKEYVEVPLSKDDESLDETRNEVINDDDVIREKLAETLNKAGPNQIQDEPVKIRLPLKKLEDSLEIMLAIESHSIRKRYYWGRALDGRSGDIASALSGNSLVGRKEATENEVEDSGKTESKMLMFNGLYFRGSWGIPFQQLRSDPEDVFWLTPETNKRVQMMRSRGSFKVAQVEDMGLQAIELPYENKRYTILIVLPNDSAPQGLVDLIENMDENCFAAIQSSLKDEMISMTLPKFRIESIARAEKSLIKSGVSDVFSPLADLAGITQEQKIHLEELVQHVTLRVDEGASSENFLTAVDAQERSAIDEDASERSLAINRPFLYFVRDIENDVILVAGIFSQPQVIDETPVVVDVAEDNDE